MTSNWDQVYSKNFMTMWYPNEDIIRFCALLIQKKLTHDRYEVKRKVERVLDLGSEQSPFPWWLAKKGAHVTLVETGRNWVEQWEAVKVALGKPNVELITSPIAEVRERSVLGEDGVER